MTKSQHLSLSSILKIATIHNTYIYYIWLYNNALNTFFTLFQPVLHNWYNKHSIYYEVVHIKDPLLLIGKCCPGNGGSGFTLLLNGPLPLYL